MAAFHLLLAIIAMIILVIIPWGILALGWIGFFTYLLPYLAFLVFTGGVLYRLLVWARSPVPFRIPTTCGQERSLPWIKANPLESPSGIWGVLGRMALEVLFFRSLFRNSKVNMGGGRPLYDSTKWLWLFALLFHWSLFVIVLRHLRFFIEPLTPCIALLSALDGFFEIALPTVYISNGAILFGLTYLLLRRVFIPKVRYISLFSDYFSLLLILGVVVSGIIMRHFFPVDLLQIKTLARGWVTFSPVTPQAVSPFFYLHLFLVSALLIWIPFSKLIHAGGVLLSPTRNLANDNRRRRHINPWNAPVKVHTYADYEKEFREQMKTAGLPVEEN